MRSAKRAVFSLMLYANVFHFHVYKTFRSGYASCLMQWSSATPSPDLDISPNVFIHILIFSYSSPSIPSSPYDKQNIILVTPKSVQILWNQPSCPFKIQNHWEVGPRNLFLKIFTGDSYDQAGLLNPIPDYLET